MQPDQPNQFDSQNNQPPVDPGGMNNASYASAPPPPPPDPNQPGIPQQPQPQAMPPSNQPPTENVPTGYQPNIAVPSATQLSTQTAVPQQAAGTQVQPQVNPNDPQTMQNALTPTKSNPNSTQNTLQISEIRDGIMIMADGSYRAVIYTKSINFDLMSPQEREAVESGYQSFLNSLYFPVQIYIRSQKIDMRPYMQRLSNIRDNQDNMLLSVLMDDYIDFINSLVEQANIMDKKFYVVIPYFPPLSSAKAVQSGKNFFQNVFGSSEQVVTINEDDLNQAKSELANRVQATLGSLIQMGLQGVALDTQELIELFYSAYNPETASRQHLVPVNDLETPVVTKGSGEAPQPHLDQAGF